MYGKSQGSLQNLKIQLVRWNPNRDQMFRPNIYSTYQWGFWNMHAVTEVLYKKYSLATRQKLHLIHSGQRITTKSTYIHSTYLGNRAFVADPKGPVQKKTPRTHHLITTHLQSSPQWRRKKTEGAGLWVGQSSWLTSVHWVGWILDGVALNVEKGPAWKSRMPSHARRFWTLSSNCSHRARAVLRGVNQC